MPPPFFMRKEAGAAEKETVYLVFSYMVCYNILVNFSGSEWTFAASGTKLF